MTTFKVALIDKELAQVPAWVPGKLADAGIEFVCANCTDGREMLALAEECNILWIYGGSRLASAENLTRLDACTAVIRSGSGVDRIDVDAATRLGMVVINTPHAHDDAVSDHAIAFIFGVGRRIVQQDQAMRHADWSRRDSMLPLWKLRGRTLGLIGFGNIPRYMVRKLAGFDLRIIVHDPFIAPNTLAAYGIESADFDTLLAEADIVSIHTPLTAETYHLIDDAAFACMKPNALLINTARGPVVDETALVRALTAGRIAGAGLDVFEEEPTKSNNPLFDLDTVVVTPHTAGFSDESIELTWRLSVEACMDINAGYFPRSYVNHNVAPRRSLKPPRSTQPPLTPGN